MLLPAASGWAWHVGIGLVWVGGECYCPPLPMVERACKEYGSHVGVGPPGLCAGEDSLFGFALLQRTVGYALARALCSTSVGARIWGGLFMYAPRPYWPMIARLAVDASVRYCERCFLDSVITQGGGGPRPDQMCAKCLYSGVVARLQGRYSWGRTIETPEPFLVEYYNIKLSDGCYKSDTTTGGCFDLHLAIGGSGKLGKMQTARRALVNGAVVVFRVPVLYGLFNPGSTSWVRHGPISPMYDHRTIVRKNLDRWEEGDDIDIQCHQGAWVRYHDAACARLGSLQPALQPAIEPGLCRVTDLEATPEVGDDVEEDIPLPLVNVSDQWFNEADEWIYGDRRRRRMTHARAAWPAGKMLTPSTDRNIRSRQKYGIIPLTPVEQ